MDLLQWSLSPARCSHCSQLSLLPYNSRGPPCPFLIGLSPSALALLLQDPQLTLLSEVVGVEWWCGHLWAGGSSDHLGWSPR